MTLFEYNKKQTQAHKKRTSKAIQLRILFLKIFKLNLLYIYFFRVQSGPATYLKFLVQRLRAQAKQKYPHEYKRVKIVSYINRQKNPSHHRGTATTKKLHILYIYATKRFILIARDGIFSGVLCNPLRARRTSGNIYYVLYRERVPRRKKKKEIENTSVKAPPHISHDHKEQEN